MATRTVPATESRAKFLQMLREVEEALTHFIITRQGRPAAVLMSYEEFEGWLETVALLRDPEWVKWRVSKGGVPVEPVVFLEDFLGKA